MRVLAAGLLLTACSGQPSADLATYVGHGFAFQHPRALAVVELPSVGAASSDDSGQLRAGHASPSYWYEDEAGAHSRMTTRDRYYPGQERHYDSPQVNIIFKAPARSERPSVISLDTRRVEGRWNSDTLRLEDVLPDSPLAQLTLPDILPMVLLYETRTSYVRLGARAARGDEMYGMAAQEWFLQQGYIVRAYTEW
ncbi:MAG: hypothetical protein EXR63_01660 [Dehalococcoidia bacterium]|nr:hypothetical protein [Dehalococcoidia bacterium]